MIMTTMQINARCKEIAMEFWGLNFNIPVKISKKMTRTLGQLKCKRINFEPIDLTFAHTLLVNYNPETIDSVIVHEVTHWALCTLKKPFADKHPYFEKELKRVGGSSTRTIKKAGVLHKIICEKCDKTIFLGTEQKKNNIMKKVNRASTSCCGWSFKYVGCEVVEDTYSKV